MFAARMAYCGPRGIPLSQFLTWARTDQDAALAWAAHESRRCRSCGTHPDELPVHAHIDTCTGCVERDRISDQAKDVPGGHVHMAAGAAEHCSRCARESKANTPRR